MKQLKKCILLLLIMLMCITSVSFAWAEEGDESDPFEPGPIMEEPEDNTLNFVLDEENEVRSGHILSTVLQNQLKAEIDTLLNFKPISADEINRVIESADDYLLSGGYDQSSENVAVLLQQNSDLTIKANRIGLEETGEDLYEIIETGNNETGYIYVINRDSLAFQVTDEDGEGIANALVTITYTDGSGNSVTRSQYTTSGALSGLCAFDKMKEVNYATIDVQAQGYRAQTVLDKKIMAGDIVYYQLKESPADDVYLRCVDLEGKDLLLEDTAMTLVFDGSEPLEMRVIVTATGNKSLPDTITLKDHNTDRSISTFDQHSSVSPGGQLSRMFNAKQDWLRMNNLLKDGDLLSFDVDGQMQDLPYATVKNAVMLQGTSNEQLPLSGSDTKIPLTDVLGGTGIVNFTVNYFKVPVTVGVFPEGGFIIVATIDIESLSTQYSSLFENSWNPKTRSETESILEPFKQEFWRKADRFKNGEGQMNDSKRVSLATDKYWSFNVAFSLFCSGVHNEKTGNFDGSFGGLFDARLSGGVTQYFLVSTPIVVPFYLGFNVFGEFKSGITANFLWNKLSDGIGAAFSSADHALTERYDLMVGLNLYAGVGLKGVCCLEAGGGGMLDFAAVNGTVEEPNKDATRFLIDSFASIKVTGAIAFFNFTLYNKVFGPWRLFDTHPDKPLLGEAADGEIIEFIDTDLAATNEKGTLLTAGDEEGKLAQYKLDDAGFTSTVVNGYQTITPLTQNSYGDGQIQIVSTQKTSALFRIASIDDHARVIYQKQDPVTGKFTDEYYVLPTLLQYDVTEFDVSTSTDGNNLAYVGCIVADPEEKDVEKRALSTRVQGLVIDLDTDEVKIARVKSPLTDINKYYYHNPRVAGKGHDLAVAYQKSPSYLATDISEACVFGTNEKETVIGKGTIYTSGDIVTGEPSFFVRNREQSSAEFLVVDGYMADGSFDENDPRQKYKLNVSDYTLGENENYITNWGYENGTNYAIICGKLYFLEKYADSSYGYGMRFSEVENSDGLINRDNIYEFVMTDDNSGLCIVAVTTGVNVNMETGENEITGANIRIYTVESHYDEADQSNKAKLHGPLDIFVDDIDIGTFAAVFNRENCASKGLSIVYANVAEMELTSEGKIALSTDLYQWQQNLRRGMETTAVDFEDLFYYTDTHVLPVYVTYRNLGYAIEGPIAFTIKDETGYQLHEAYILPQQGDIIDIGPEVVHNPAKLYTGDSYQYELLLLANPYWEENVVHEITIEVAPEYRGDANVRMLTSAYDNKLTLKGRQIVLGDKHYADLAVTNIGGKDFILNNIAMEIRYEDEKKPYHTTYISLASVVSNPDKDHYNIKFDLTPFWEDAENDGILSIRFYLTDEDAEPITGESVFMYPRTINEYEEEPVEISYEITEGADGTWQKGSDEDHQITVIRSTDEETCYSHFRSVLIDGTELIRDEEYTAVSGSTVITLKKEMMESLTEEEHDVTITFDDGEVETTLTITEEQEEPQEDDTPVIPDIPDNPATGDTSNLILWVGLLGGSLAGILLVLILYMRKRRNQ